MNLNLNQAECLKEQLNFTGKTIINVCNGEQTFIPWGSLQIASGIGMFLLLTCVVCVLGFMIKSLIDF